MSINCSFLSLPNHASTNFFLRPFFLFVNAGREGIRGSGPGPALSWSHRVKFSLGAAKGLKHIHLRGQVHGNIKSRNILIFDDYGVVKISGFDLSSQAPGTLARLNSYGYHAPE